MEQDEKDYAEENVADTEEQESKGTHILTDEVLKKEAVGSYLDKSELEGVKRTVTVSNLGKNQWDRYVLGIIMDTTPWQVNISKVNYNELIDILGPRLSEWSGKQVMVEGVHFDGNPNRDPPISPGTMLKFSKA